MMDLRQKTHIKAFAVLSLIILLTMGFYSYQKYKEYSLFKTAVATNEAFVVLLRDSASDEKSLYDSNKEGFDTLNKEIEEKLAYIFPATDEYTTLTRQLDAFEDDLTSTSNPFDVSSIEFQPVTEDVYYSIPKFS
jgi:hypothetical protein